MKCSSMKELSLQIYNGKTNVFFNDLDFNHPGNANWYVLKNAHYKRITKMIGKQCKSQQFINEKTYIVAYMQSMMEQQLLL